MAVLTSAAKGNCHVMTSLLPCHPGNFSAMNSDWNPCRQHLRRAMAMAAEATAVDRFYRCCP